MREHARTVMLVALAGLTWVLVVLLAGMLLAVASGPSVMGLVQLGLVAVLVYPVIALYGVVMDAGTPGEVLSVLGSRGQAMVTVLLFVAAFIPSAFPGRAIVGFPLFNAPSMLYPAVVEVRGLLGGWVGVVLPVGVVWLQAVWSYLLADAGYGAVTAVFKRRRPEG